MKLTDLVKKLIPISNNQEVLKRFLDLGLPTKKSEAYRYANVEKLFEKDYKVLKDPLHQIEHRDEILIVNGKIHTAPEGIRVYYATSNADNINLEHDDPLYFLGHLLSPEKIYIEIDGDKEISIRHRITEASALIHYRIHLSNQVNRHASIYEHFEFENAEETLVLYGYDLNVKKDSTFSFVKNQYASDKAAVIIASHDVKVQKQASLVLKSFDFGNTFALQLYNIVLETNANIDMGQLLYLWGDVKRGTISKIIHRGESSHSIQEAKNVLEDASRGIFDALIKVENTAKYTKVEQNSKTILLGESAYMVAKPQLEIYIDELEASHGATIGQLDEKQLFYLRSRGIAQVEARRMLIVAFVTQLLENIRDKRQQERIEENFKQAFDAQHQKNNKRKD